MTADLISKLRSENPCGGMPAADRAQLELNAPFLRCVKASLQAQVTVAARVDKRTQVLFSLTALLAQLLLLTVLAPYGQQISAWVLLPLVVADAVLFLYAVIVTEAVGRHAANQFLRPLKNRVTASLNPAGKRWVSEHSKKESARHYLIAALDLPDQLEKARLHEEQLANLAAERARFFETMAATLNLPSEQLRTLFDGYQKLVAKEANSVILANSSYRVACSQ